MSSDLLREFGDASETPLSRSYGQDDDGEDFGDFEGAGSLDSKTEHSAVPQTSATQLDVLGIKNLPHQQSAKVRRQQQDTCIQNTGPPSNIDDDWGDFNGATVLFDAEQLEPSRLSKPRSKESFVEKPVNVSLLPIAPRGTILRKTRTPQAQPTALYDFDEPENWGPIAAGQENLLPGSATTQATPSTVPEWGLKLRSTTQATEKGPTPSNVPPPSVLLSVVTNIFQRLPRDIKDIATEGRASSDAYEALEQPQIDRIKELLSSTRAVARIIAGRRFRWKRDSLLSQSMKIGPASKSGGMKLTGVDKTESRREDQETAEVLNAWRKQVGPLRSTISLVNVHLHQSGLAVPEISENMPIRVVKPSEGAVSAPKCCFLCGIKRDERVAKVDANVEDSFGEFWTEHWGHVDCVSFWESHKHLLPHR